MNIHRYAGKTANNVGVMFYQDMLAESKKNGSSRNGLEDRLAIVDEKHSREGYEDLDIAPLTRGEIDFLGFKDRKSIIEKACIAHIMKAKKRP